MPEGTPELSAKDLRTLIPEYEGLALATTLLNPEPGEPGVRESSLGGALLWPADEPWPYCAQEDHWTFGSDLRNTHRDRRGDGADGADPPAVRPGRAGAGVPGREGPAPGGVVRAEP